jgi:hypothetical protein
MQSGLLGGWKSRAQGIERFFKSWFRGVSGDAWGSIPYVSESEPVIIGGCGRSGTTLLSAMIDAHPLFFCGPESRWSEKTPGNVRVLDRIFEYFPRARFIHVIRDGRDVVCSTRTHPKFRVVDGKEVLTGILRPADECAERWVE